MIILFVTSLYAGLTTDKLAFSMAKQMIGITFSAIAYYNLYRYTNFDVKKIFNIYLNIAIVVAAIGVVQEVMLLRGMIQYFNNVKRVSLGFYRVYSIMGEPYFLAVALIPAVYYYLNSMIGVKTSRDFSNWWKLGVVLLCYLFTFSSAGIFGIGVMLLLILNNHGVFSPSNGKFYLFILLALIVIPNTNMSKVFSLKELEIRATDSYKAFTNGKPLSKDEAADLNSSTFALYSNYVIALESFSANPLTGSGLGTHEKTYDDYFGEKFGLAFKIMYGNFNAKDGNSLFIRMMSETGIIGLSMLLIFIFSFRISRKYVNDPELWPYVIFNQGVFVVFVIRLMRTGNYIGQGFFLFFFLYYLSYVILRFETQKRITATE
jgi:O-antigen ligase